MKLTARFMHQWQFLYQKCSWYDFSFVKLYVGDDRMFSNFSVEAWFFGLGFEVVWNYRRNSKVKELAKKIQGLQGDEWRTRDD